MNNDGFLDFYLGTGYPAYEAIMPNLMFLNRRGFGFADVTTSGGFGHLQKGHAISFADFDNDGDQDVFAEMGGGYAGDGFMNALFENPGQGGHWLKLRLVGVRSNRSGVGARIRLEIVDGRERRSIHREVGNGSSFGGNPLLQEIGLGAATQIETLEIFWPASGVLQRFSGLEVDQAIEVTEGENEIRPLPHRPLPFAPATANRSGHQHHSE